MWEIHVLLCCGGLNIFSVHPYLGKIPILTNMFQMGWNHQPDLDVTLHKKLKYNLFMILVFYYGSMIDTVLIDVELLQLALNVKVVLLWSCFFEPT